MNWLARMFGSAPKNVMVDPERRALGWTTPEELANAQKYDLAYGDPSAGFFQPGAMMRIPRNLPDMLSAYNERRLSQLPGQPIDKEMAERLQAAWLAAQSSPLAALGFDPRAMVTAPSKMTEGRDLTLGGSYSPKEDRIFTTGKFDSTFVHESIHRGIAKLRKAGLLPKEARLYNEEMLTRAFMLKYYGNIEEGRGEIGDSQVRMGRNTLENKFNRKMLSDLEDAAAQYIAQQRPRGPR